MCAQWKLRSAWASAKSDQSSQCAKWVAEDLRWAHMPLCWFCHEAAHLLLFLGCYLAKRMPWCMKMCKLFLVLKNRTQRKDAARKKLSLLTVFNFLMIQGTVFTLYFVHTKHSGILLACHQGPTKHLFMVIASSFYSKHYNFMALICFRYLSCKAFNQCIN